MHSIMTVLKVILTYHLPFLMSIILLFVGREVLVSSVLQSLFYDALTLSFIEAASISFQHGLGQFSVTNYHR